MGKNKKETMISVIIPALNEEKYIGRTLESLKHQDYCNFEVIVGDGGSRDKTVQISKKYGARVITDSGSIAAARNKGAEIAKGEILAFTDADSVLPAGWLSRIAEDFRDPELIGLGGVMKPLNRKLKHRILFYLINDLYPRMAAKFRFYSFIGSNSIYRADAFRKVGGFNEKVEIMEDNELANRIKKIGKVRFDPNLVGYTEVRRLEKSGYLRTAFKFWKVYWNLYIRGRKEIRAEYKVIR